MRITPFPKRPFALQTPRTLAAFLRDAPENLPIVAHLEIRSDALQKPQPRQNRDHGKPNTQPSLLPRLLAPPPTKLAATISLTIAIVKNKCKIDVGEHSASPTNEFSPMAMEAAGMDASACRLFCFLVVPLGRRAGESGDAPRVGRGSQGHGYVGGGRWDPLRIFGFVAWGAVGGSVSRGQGVRKLSSPAGYSSHYATSVVEYFVREAFRMRFRVRWFS